MTSEHSACDHDATPAARRACRAAMTRLLNEGLTDALIAEYDRRDSLTRGMSDARTRRLLGPVVDELLRRAEADDAIAQAWLDNA